MTRSRTLLILAHRGASVRAADNTIEAYRLAADAGADGIECDVRFTADGAVVMHHDPTVDDMGPLIDLDFETLRRARPEIPTLDETLAAAPGLLLNIEIKNQPGEPDFDPSHRMAAWIATWVDRHDLYERTIVSSFNRATIDRTLAHNSRATTGLLLDHRTSIRPSLTDLAASGHRWVLPHHTRLQVGPRATIAAIHDAGLAVGTWTLDRVSTIERLAAAGLDAVITNDPAAVVAAYPA